MNRVYIVIVNFNGWRDTIECLESIFQCDYPDFRVVICDNGSTDNSLENIKSWSDATLMVSPPSPNSPLLPHSSSASFKPLSLIEYARDAAECGGDKSADPQITLIRNGANLGFAGGNNVGIRYALARADFSYIWLLNNDTVIENNALSSLVQRMVDAPGTGMCGSTIRYFHNPDRVQALGGGWHCRWIGLPWHYGRGKSRGVGPDVIQRAEAWMNYVEGASMLVSKQFLEEIGLMCEDYFLYFEETDWAIRSHGRYKLAYAASSVVYHKVGASIGTSSNPSRKSYLCDYYSIRNRLFFTRRFYPYALPIIYLTLLCTLFIRILLGRWDRVAMIARLLAGEYNAPLKPAFTINPTRI